MTKIQNSRLKDIFNNKTLGSSELVQQLNQYFLSNINNMSGFGEIVDLIKKKLGHFKIVNSYLKELEHKIKKGDDLELIKFLQNYTQSESNKTDIIFKKIYPYLKDKNKVLTLSRSGTVLDILKLWKQENKKLEVIVCESRPKYEGSFMAKDLAKFGIRVKLITDAMMGLIVPKIDVAIIGADIILNNGNAVNKVGSAPLALLCREYKKPFYVVSTKSKKSRKKIFKPKQENPEEILKNKIKNLSASNIYFEEIDRKFITKIITD
jgi:translation initiation factor 2B subunit (eIF-2B alpha/beta/delta family)